MRQSTAMSGMWTDAANDPRVTDLVPSGEKEVLQDYLDRLRTTIDLKCDGLTTEQLAMRSVPPSKLSLLGLVRHLAKMEYNWHRRILEGRTDLPRMYWAEDDPDLAFTGAVADEAVVIDAWESWFREITHARRTWADLDLDATVDVAGRPYEVREVVVHLVEEYARHAGHADLLREAIDGRVGL